MTALFLYPLATVVHRSFTDPSVGIGNYDTFFTNAVYLRVLRNSVALALLTTLVSIAVALPVAYCLSTLRGRSFVIIVGILTLTMWASVLVRAYAWVVLIGPTGPVSTELARLRLLSPGSSLVPGAIGLMVGMTQYMVPFLSLMLAATLRSIEPSVGMAAQSLGANTLQRTFRITLPLASRGIIAASSLVFLLSIGFYVIPALLGGPRQTVLSQNIQENMTSVFNIGFACAEATILAAVAIVLYAVYLRFARGESVIGAMG
jgi:ABC-type spermidine/putrescine transport system permease subunit I